MHYNAYIPEMWPSGDIFTTETMVLSSAAVMKLSGLAADGHAAAA